MKKLNQSGIAHLAAIFLVVVVVAVGGAGWYVWQNNKTENTKNEQSNSSYEDEIGNTFKLVETGNPISCNNTFEITIPDDWHVYYVNNEGDVLKQCVVSNVTSDKFPPVGSLDGENIDFTFVTYPAKQFSLDDIVNMFEEDGEERDGAYPYDVLSKESIKLNNGDEAMLVYTDGGHYQTEDTHFFHIKDEDVIYTAWRTNSKLADNALQAVKTVN